MGKYMRKGKISEDIAVMDVSQYSLGVRTRAKTLALQRLQATTTTASPAPPQKSELCYLQLRNRRLKKSPLKQSCKDSCRENTCPKNPCENPIPKTSLSFGLDSSNSGSGSVSISSFSNKKEGFLINTPVVAREEDETKDNCSFGSEACFGDNNLEFEGRERSTTENTPCSLIGVLDNPGTPGSSARPTNLSIANQRIWNSVQRNMPTTTEIEEFFACAELHQQSLFAEKYNFDIANDLPLPGHYEWVRL